MMKSRYIYQISKEEWEAGKEFSTFEPSTDVKDIFKPDLLMLERYASDSK